MSQQDADISLRLPDALSNAEGLSPVTEKVAAKTEEPVQTLPADTPAQEQERTGLGAAMEDVVQRGVAIAVQGKNLVADMQEKRVTDSPGWFATPAGVQELEKHGATLNDSNTSLNNGTTTAYEAERKFGRDAERVAGEHDKFGSLLLGSDFQSAVAGLRGGNMNYAVGMMGENSLTTAQDLPQARETQLQMGA